MLIENKIEKYVLALYVLVNILNLSLLTIQVHAVKLLMDLCKYQLRSFHLFHGPCLLEMPSKHAIDLRKSDAFSLVNSA